MDGGAWKAALHGVSEGWTRLSIFTFTFHFHALKKEMATHSSVLAWRIPGTGEPGGLPSVGLHRVGHDWSDLALAANISLDQNFSRTWMCCILHCESPERNRVWRFLQTFFPWYTHSLSLSLFFFGLTFKNRSNLLWNVVCQFMQ